MAKKKTRKEKERIKYHLEGILLKQKEKMQERDREEFGYLEAKYIRKDLIKTVVYSLVILGLIFVAKRFFG